jgi:hypothetical protein
MSYYINIFKQPITRQICKNFVFLDSELLALSLAEGAGKKITNKKGFTLQLSF